MLPPFHKVMIQVLIDESDLGKRPDPYRYFTDNIILRDGTHNRIPAVYRIGAPVTHHKIAGSRNFVWEFQIAVAQSLVGDVWFFKKFFVYIDVSFAVDDNNVLRKSNDSLQQNLTLIIEASP